MIERFDMGYDPRRNFRNWLDNNFTYFNSQRNEKSLEEISQNMSIIFAAADQVLRFTEEKSGPVIQKYYEGDCIFIRKTYHARNLAKFVDSLQSFRDAIDVE